MDIKKVLCIGAVLGAGVGYFLQMNEQPTETEHIAVVQRENNIGQVAYTEAKKDVFVLPRVLPSLTGIVVAAEKNEEAQKNVLLQDVEEAVKCFRQYGRGEIFVDGDSSRENLLLLDSGTKIAHMGYNGKAIGREYVEECQIESMTKELRERVQQEKSKPKELHIWLKYIKACVPEEEKAIWECIQQNTSPIMQAQWYEERYYERTIEDSNILHKQSILAHQEALDLLALEIERLEQDSRLQNSNTTKSKLFNTNLTQSVMMKTLAELEGMAYTKIEKMRPDAAKEAHTMYIEGIDYFQKRGLDYFEGYLLSFDETRVQEGWEKTKKGMQEVAARMDSTKIEDYTLRNRLGWVAERFYCLPAYTADVEVVFKPMFDENLFE